MKNRIQHLGFTLLELMVATVVLLAVMIAVGRIFGTTSDVSASGQAISQTMQQGVAIEQQLREDIEKLTREGFVAIRSVALANDMQGEYLLIDDSLPPEAIIRCDQLMFFTDGFATPMLNTISTSFSGQGLATRLYYGHGVKFPELSGMGQDGNGLEESSDPVYFDTVWTPWHEGIVDVETRQYRDGQTGRFDLVGSAYQANGTQGLPNSWTLCRQAIVLGDDDQQAPNSTRKTVYMEKGVSSHTIFPWDPRIDYPVNNGDYTSPHVLHGRVDIAATQLDDVRQSVLQIVEGDETERPWRNPNVLDQQELIASTMYWPRVETYPVTTDRYDQALMLSAIAQGCVSFQVEWTYDEGVGEVTGENWVSYTGYQYDDALVQPWWGSSYRENDGTISFNTLKYWTENPEEGDVPAQLVNPDNIEPIFNIGEGPLYAPVPTVQDEAAEYWAIFGYNGHDPLHPDWVYTPRPSALRITLRLQDRENRLGAGWTYQFIVDLPGQK